MFVQHEGCRVCKQRAINPYIIEACLFPTKVTGRSSLAGPGWDLIHPYCQLLSHKIEHPSLILILWVLFCPSPHQHPHNRGTTGPPHTTQPGSLPFPCDISKGQAGAENAAEDGGTVGRQRAEIQSHLLAQQNPLTGCSSLKSRDKRDQERLCLVKEPS